MDKNQQQPAAGAFRTADGLPQWGRGRRWMERFAQAVEISGNWKRLVLHKFPFSGGEKHYLEVNHGKQDL
jgi:anti-sigma regulatory factor (Ser/Thr protein kinase)